MLVVCCRHAQTAGHCCWLLPCCCSEQVRTADLVAAVLAQGPAHSARGAHSLSLLAALDPLVAAGGATPVVGTINSMQQACERRCAGGVNHATATRLLYAFAGWPGTQGCSRSSRCHTPQQQMHTCGRGGSQALPAAGCGQRAPAAPQAAGWPPLLLSTAAAVLLRRKGTAA